MGHRMRKFFGSIDGILNLSGMKKEEKLYHSRQYSSTFLEGRKGEQDI
jgi:hypothetical protein